MKQIEKVVKELYPISEELQSAFINGATWQENNIILFLTELKDKIDSFECTVNQNSYIKELIDEWLKK